MAAGDWIKLHRRILDSEVFADPWLLKLWIWCLCKANFKPMMFYGQLIPRGSFVTGRIAGSEELNVSPSKFYRGLKKMELMGCIRLETNSSWTTVSVCKYDLYQFADTPERTTSEQQVSAGVNSQRTQEKEFKNSRTTPHSPPSHENGKTKPGGVALNWPREEKAAVIAELAERGLGKAVAAANDAERAGITPEGMRDLLFEYDENRSKFKSAGAIWERIKNGAWPADGVLTTEAVTAAVAKRAAKTETADHETVLYRVIKQGRVDKIPDEQIRAKLRSILPGDFLDAQGW